MSGVEKEGKVSKQCEREREKMKQRSHPSRVSLPGKDVDHKAL